MPPELCSLLMNEQSEVATTEQLNTSIYLTVTCWHFGDTTFPNLMLFVFPLKYSCFDIIYNWYWSNTEICSRRKGYTRETYVYFEPQR